MKLSKFKRNLRGVELLIDLNDLRIYHPQQNKLIMLVRDNRSFIDENGLWQVYPIGFSQIQVFIICPYCGEIHCHGKSNENYKGRRIAHCVDYKGGDDYYIRDIVLENNTTKIKIAKEKNYEH